MNRVVVDASLGLAALSALPGVLGSLQWYRCEASKVFWLLLRAAQAGALVLAAGVGVLAAAGRSSSDRLFYLYAVLPIAISFVAEQLRVTSAQAVLDQRGLSDAQAVGMLPEAEQRGVVGAIVRREMGVMALSSLVVVFLALRAAGTAHGF
jgi:hypothetical protein